jgi:hypothetical protein
MWTEYLLDILRNDPERAPGAEVVSLEDFSKGPSKD